MGAYRDWTTSCPDWERRIVAGESLITYEPHFPEVSEYALEVFKELVLVDVMGSPLMGEVTRDWVYDFVRAIFGCYDPVKNKRLIQEFFLLISKKNTKSTLAAGIMLTALILNERSSAELVILAPTKEVADNSFIPLRDFINADEELKERFKVVPTMRKVIDKHNGACINVIAADSNAAAGKKATVILIDEVWLFGQRPQSESLFREAKGGLTSRPEGCVIYLSTMSDKPPAGVFKSLLEQARKVRDGLSDDNCLLPVLYEFPSSMIENKDYLKPENFYITNPNLGASVSEDYLIREFKKVVDNPFSLPDFLAKHLNVEITSATSEESWIGNRFWADNLRKEVDLDFLIENSDVITMGGDGGGLDDLLGVAVVGRDKEDPMLWRVWVHAFCHEIVLERRKKISHLLLDFAKDGDLTIYKNIGEDADGICEILSKCYESGKLSQFGIDPAMTGSIGVAVKVVAASYGIEEEDLVIGIKQGLSMMVNIIAAERRLAEGNLHHGASSMMDWCMSNATIHRQKNAFMLVKEDTGYLKIDPVIAMINAIALMLTSPSPSAGDCNIYV